MFVMFAKWLILFLSPAFADSISYDDGFSTGKSARRIPLNEGWVGVAGNDSTGRFGNPKKPFRTVQGAVSKTVGESNPPWTIHVGIGKFTNDVPIIISNGCIVTGYGIGLTELVSKFRLNEYGAAVNPRDNAQIHNLTISQLWTSNLAAPFGCYAEAFRGNQYSFTNVYVRNVRMVGKSDNFYLYNLSSCSATFDNCLFDGGGNSWDLVANGGHPNNFFVYNACSFLTVGPPFIGGQTRVGNLYEGTNIFNRCFITALDGLYTTYAFEMHFGLSRGNPKGHLELNECQIRTFSKTGDVKDIVNSVGAMVIVRGEFDTNKSVGPITVEP